MIKIKTEVINNKKSTCNIVMEYEQGGYIQVGEYLAILDKIKNEVLDNTCISSEELQKILFK